MTTRARPLLRALARLVAVAPVLASLTVVASAARVGPAIGGCAQASTLHHAALVVEHSNPPGSGHGAGSVVRVCVSFSEDSISGDALLARSGVQYGTGDSGQAVCQIDSEPSSYQPQCLSAGAPYWAMYVSRAGGPWVYSSQGFAAQQFGDGDAEGFRYEGQSDGTTPPSPAGVCPAQPSPTVAPTRPASATVPRRTAAAKTRAAVVPTPTGVATAASSSPAAATASGSGSARAATAVTASNRSASLRPEGSGAWVAGGLGVALVAALVAQLARARRRTSRRPPP